MMHFEKFKYDEMRVVTEGTSQFCIPVITFQPELNLILPCGGSPVQTEKSFKNLDDSRKFPLDCAFHLPNGVYSTYLFRVCTTPKNDFGINISHFEYKGKNPALSTMNTPLENCPFDEILPVPAAHVNATNDNQTDLKAQCVYLESLINGPINEAGMRKKGVGIIESLNFNFSQYLYN